MNDIGIFFAVMLPSCFPAVTKSLFANNASERVKYHGFTPAKTRVNFVEIDTIKNYLTEMPIY